MNRLKGIIFDFDGTLADTLPVCILSFQQALERTTGRKFIENELTAHFGKSEEGIAAALAPEKYEETLSAYIEIYRENHHLCPDVFPGIRQILDELAENNIKMALITGKGQHTIDIALEYMDLKKYFEYVEFGSPVKLIKAESMAKILQLWGLKSQEIAYVGDQPTDITESEKAGVVSVAVSWAVTSNHELLKSYEPDFLFSRLHEFKNWLNVQFMDAAKL